MKELLHGQPIQQEIVGFKPDSNAAQNVNVPAVLRNAQGRIRWTLPSNTPEENEQIGIQNIQGLFLEKFPEFLERFPFGEDGVIPEENREEATKFILENLGTFHKFSTVISGAALKKKVAPYFGSLKKTLNKSFEPWGIKACDESSKNKDVANLSYDGKGKIIWRVKGGIPEDYLKLGINNIRALVTSEVPELSTFPRDENGRIREEDRKQVESLILERVRRNKTLADALIRNNKHNKRIPYPEQNQYFRRNTIYTLRIAFQEYGLFEDKVQKSLEIFLERNRRREETRSKQDQEIPSTIRLVDNKNNAASTVKCIDQTTGREKLFRLIKGELTIDDIEPIYITRIRNYQNESASLYSNLYIGAGVLISINAPLYKAYEEKGALLAISKKDEQFGYQWLDFYAVEQNNTVDLNNKLDSIRANTDDGRFESYGWYSPEQQAFIDYLDGNLNLEDSSELPSFVVKIHNTNRRSRKRIHSIVYIGRSRGKIYELPFTHIRQTSCQEVLVKTKCDKKRNYEWIEGYDVKDTEFSNPLFTRKIIDAKTKGKDDQQENKKRKKLVEWKGPKIQSIIDWAYGKLSTEDFDEVEVLLNQDNKQANLFLEGQRLKIILVANKLLDRSKPIYISAKEDNLYKWLEVQQDDNTSNERKVISSLHLEYFEGKPKLNRQWQDYERQRIIDDNKLSSNRSDFNPSELPPELRQEILDRFAEFLEDNPDTKISVVDFAMEYLQKHNLTL